MSFGLTRQEARHIRLGEMLDLMAANGIANGSAEQKQTAVTRFEDAMKVR